jgi:hypothetical protein
VHSESSPTSKFGERPQRVVTGQSIADARKLVSFDGVSVTFISRAFHSNQSVLMTSLAANECRRHKHRTGCGNIANGAREQPEVTTTAAP